MGKGRKTGDKFQFDIAFQESILKYTVTDKKGYQLVSLYEDYYFDLLDHQIIALALKQYYKKKKRIPSSETVVKERLRQLFISRDFKGALVDEDRARINKLVSSLYKGHVKDGEDILESCKMFAQFVATKITIEEFDVTDFNKYAPFQKKIQKSLHLGREFEKSKGTFLVADVRVRQLDRQMRDSVIATPFNQLNRTTNAGGYTKGSVVVVLDKAKAFKTGFLANVARGLLSQRKNVLIIDLENGEDSIALRLEQQLVKKNKSEILSGNFDDKVQKVLRKYNRLGVEVVIKRFPAYTTSCTDIQIFIDDIYNEYGLRFDQLIVDYAGLLGSSSGTKDELARISEAYVELKNLAEHNELDCIWTAHHVRREAYQRRPTCYKPDDVAKAIDIHRHVDVMLGLNRNEEEERNGVLRCEIIDQRDGYPSGRAFFWANEDWQRLDEFTKEEAKEYQTQMDSITGGDEPKQRRERPPKNDL